MQEIRPIMLCPRCHGSLQALTRFNNGFEVTCQCGFSGPRQKNSVDAVEAWDECTKEVDLYAR